ncbi:MAG: hypothetical protein KJZ84_09655 [Bryobacteraceae bacterium]|nr:hypothetical protein [Bryobacteraceae bacterium]
MEILGSRRYVEIPGDRQHDLPPLLLRTAPEPARYEHAMELAGSLIDEEELIPNANLPVIDPAIELMFDRRRTDLALQLVEQYVKLIDAWRLGDSIVEWIRQCETTFELRPDLRPLLRPDVWPHAGRSSFVTLLRDKSVDTHGVEPETAVGMRLSFRQPPPLNCFSNQFLLLLKGTLASTAYESWAKLSPDPVSSLPPERFRFEVHDM